MRLNRFGFIFLGLNRSVASVSLPDICGPAKFSSAQKIYSGWYIRDGLTFLLGPNYTLSAVFFGSITLTAFKWLLMHTPKKTASYAKIYYIQLLLAIMTPKKKLILFLDKKFWDKLVL